MEFLYLFVLIAVSVGFHLLFKIKIEQSIFFTVCLYFIIMFLSGLVFGLQAGFYIIIALGALSLGYALAKAFKKKINIWDVLTPGFVLFTAAFVIYYFSTRGALLHLWDEATHWGTAAKKMYYSKELWTSGLQTIASPIFNQVMLGFTGYKESALYLSQWVLYISCLILPLSAVKWKKSYLAAIYSAAVIFALSAVFEDGNLNLYADGLLSFFFASVFLAWHLEKEKSYKRYIWAGAGAFFLVQLKSGSGLSLAVMLMAFMLLSDAVSHAKDMSRKKIYINNVKTSVIMLAAVAASHYLISGFEKSYLAQTTIRGGLDEKIYSSWVFIAFLGFLAVAFISFVLYTIAVFTKETPKKSAKAVNAFLFASLSAAFIALLAVLFYSTVLRPDFDVRTTVLNFLTALQETLILGVPIMYLTAIIVGVYAVNTLLSKKKEKKETLAFYLAAVFLSGLYIFGILYAYLSSFTLSEAVNLASFDRYMGTALMFAIMFAFMPLLKGADIPFKKAALPLLPVAVCAVLLAFQFTPAYIAARKTSEDALVFRQTEISAKKYVDPLVGDGEKVFLVMQGDKGFVFNWMRYEFVPITTNGGYWSFGIGDGWNFTWDADKLKEFLNDAKYDYLYLFNTDDHFNETFASLFGGHTPTSKTLYKFDYKSEPVLTPVE